MQRNINVRVKGGLHARPIAELVRLSRAFRADIEILHDGRVALTRSSMKLLMLGVKEGQTVTLRGRGDDTQTAMDQICRFLDGAQAQATPPAKPAIAASDGLAIGPAFHFVQPRVHPEPDYVEACAVESELRRLQGAAARLTARIRADAACTAHAGTRQILQALSDLAEDTEWLDTLAGRVRAGMSSVAAVQQTGTENARQIAALDDPYASARAEDMRSVAHLMALELQGQKPLTLNAAPDGAIIVADELPALDIGNTDLARLGGIVCMKGAVTSHAAIIARAYGVPAVFGAEALRDRLCAAHRIAIDGARGLVIPDPDAATEQQFADAAQAAQKDAADLLRFRDVAPQTPAGHAITVAANLGSVAELDRACAAGAMGVGLFRTELMFIDAAGPPAEDDQYQVYSAILARFPEHPVIIRTLDIGADKPLRGLTATAEENPALGVRGIRLCLSRPDVFKPQLRALLRAAPHGHLKVMLPMVSDLSELRATRDLIDQCRTELTHEGTAHGTFDLGIMVETPAAVLTADLLAQEAAFFSIGTNDLTQYLMAADRLNPNVAQLCRADHPSVLAAIKAVCAAASRHGIWVGICGEAAADPALVPLFIAAGVTELSMSPGAIARVKRQICGLEGL
ncbi:MAG: phosphoenolpyruvate--protein phosphotransferase [Rhodobacteraceae bacterium]|nr:phosphoenolpyruvate--protein phosphotransferase [Paracoccaceae bacterium]